MQFQTHRVRQAFAAISFQQHRVRWPAQHCFQRRRQRQIVPVFAAAVFAAATSASASLRARGSRGRLSTPPRSRPRCRGAPSCTRPLSRTRAGTGPAAPQSASGPECSPGSRALREPWVPQRKEEEEERERERERKKERCHTTTGAVLYYRAIRRTSPREQYCTVTMSSSVAPRTAKILVGKDIF